MNREVIILDPTCSHYGARGVIIQDDGETLLVQVGDAEVRVLSAYTEEFRAA